MSTFPIHRRGGHKPETSQTLIVYIFPKKPFRWSAFYQGAPYAWLQFPRYIRQYRNPAHTVLSPSAIPILFKAFLTECVAANGLLLGCTNICMKFTNTFKFSSGISSIISIACLYNSDMKITSFHYSFIIYQIAYRIQLLFTTRGVVFDTAVYSHSLLLMWDKKVKEV